MESYSEEQNFNIYWKQRSDSSDSAYYYVASENQP